MKRKKKKVSVEKSYPLARRNSRGQVVVEDRVGSNKHQLLITADDELWANLWHQYSEDDFAVGEIPYNYVCTALMFMAAEGLTKRRGESLNQPWPLIDAIKQDSRHLYTYLNQMKTISKSLWTKSLKDFLTRLTVKDIKSPEELTLRVIKEIHLSSVLTAKREYPKFGPFRNLESYYKTYIMGDPLKRPKKRCNNTVDVIRDMMIGTPGKEKSQKEIAALPKTDIVLNHIFKHLRVEP